MSFNYLEVAEAAQLISAALPARVQNVELLEFPLAAKLSDLNLGLRLEEGKGTLLLSLRAPWTGLYLLSSSHWKLAKSSWSKAFGKAPDWNLFLKGATLQGVRAVPGDRVVELELGSGLRVEVELFSSRPNWTLNAGGETWSWREKSPRPAARPMATDFRRREFEGDLSLPWMERAYRHYKKARQEKLYADVLQYGISELQSRVTQQVKLRGQLAEALAESRGAEELRARADGLKAVLHQYPPGFRAAELDGLRLDSKFTLSENLARMYARYKKLERTRREVEVRLKGIEENIQAATARLGRARAFRPAEDEGLEQATARLMGSLEEAQVDLERFAPPATLPARTKKVDRKWQKSRLKQFKTKEGLSVWVGQNHAENAELVMRLARGNDLWVHLKGKPGAHVVVQLPGGKSPSLETLLDAATLAAHYSDVPAGGKVEVDYAFRKFVKRVAGRSPEQFLVTYSQNKTLMVKVEEERLWRLLKQQSS